MTQNKPEPSRLVSTKPHRLFPHGEFRQLAPNLWIVRGGLPFPLYRNMVVYRLPDGRLVLHSLVALSEAGMKQLEALGKPSIPTMITATVASATV